MIFVVFGNVPIPFLRLAKKIDEIACNLSEEVIVQNGYTEYAFKNVISRDFFSSNEMSEMIDKASLIISHGGYGTISECIKKGKKIIAVPRLQGEHNNSQEELVRALDNEGYLVGVYDINELGEKIQFIYDFVPKTLKRGNASKVINEYILSIIKDK